MLLRVLPVSEGDVWHRSRGQIVLQVPQLGLAKLCGCSKLKFLVWCVSVSQPMELFFET